MKVLLINIDEHHIQISPLKRLKNIIWIEEMKCLGNI